MEPKKWTINLCAWKQTDESVVFFFCHAKLPNVLGFLFGVSQMILYLIYKNAKNKVEANCTDQKQEWEGTVNNSAQNSCNDNKLNFPSAVEMKENIVWYLIRTVYRLRMNAEYWGIKCLVSLIILLF